MKWEIAKAETEPLGGTDSAEDLLADGWEPFAVTSQHVNDDRKGYASLVDTIWFKREVS